MTADLAGRAEELWTALSRERYRVWAGLEARPGLERIYAGFPELFREDTLAAVAEAAKELGDETAGRQRRLRAFLLAVRGERAAAGALERRLAWEAETVLRLGEVVVPFRRVGAEQAAEEDAERRWALEDARLTALREVEGLDRERLERVWEAWGSVTGAGYLAAWEEANGIALEPLAGEARWLLRETEDLYRELLRDELTRNLAGVRPGAARAVDGLRLERAPRFDGHFAGLDPVDVARRQLGELGLSLEAGGRVRLEREARAGGLARAFCVAIQVPGEIVLSFVPASGWRDWPGFFHALGHAQHFACTDPGLPFEDRVLGDWSVAEAWAGLFERLTWNPVWLARYVGLRGGAQKDYCRAAVLGDLLRLRRAAARLLYELELHGAGRFEGMPGLYAELLTEATGLRHDPAGYLDEVEPDLYVVRRLRGRALEASVAHVLRETYDEDWFRNPRTGPYLEELFSSGHREEAELVARRVTGEELSFARVVAAYAEVVG
ncbi:MAG TPA: hypothetical protein VIL13_02470 [Longimicrobiales bacterium]